MAISTKRVVRTVTEMSDTFFSWLGFAPTTIRALTNDTAMQNSAIRACVQLIANGVSQTPLRLIQTEITATGIEKRTVLHDHRIANLLRNPNGYQTQSEFLSMMVSNALLGKGGLALKTRSYNGEVTELHPMPYGSWEHKILDDMTYQFVVSFQNGERKTYSQDDCVFIKNLSLDGYTGVSSIEMMKTAAAISALIEKQVLSVSQSTGRPSGLLLFPGKIDAEKRKRVSEAWSSRYSADGAGGLAILDNDAKYEKMDQMSLVDAEVVANRQFQIEEICRYFGVQPGMISGDQPITDLMMRLHTTNCLTRWFVAIEQAFHKQLLMDDPSLRFDFADEELLRGSPLQQAQYVRALMGAGGSQSLLTPNEAREYLGLPPIDEDWANTISRGGYELSANPSVPTTTDTTTDTTQQQQ